VYFDTHCHLCDAAYAADLGEVLDRAAGAGVTGVLVPGTCVASSRGAVELAGRVPWVRAAVGIQPGSAAARWGEDLAAIRRLLPSPVIAAIGETGIDLHYPDGPPAAAQEELFERHIEMAEAFGLALVVHSRDAGDRVLGILGRDRPFPVILHCWTGGGEEALAAAAAGYRIGLAGPLTYPANRRLRDLAARLPRDRVLAETDGPYLPPVPLRGRRNEPAYVVRVVEAVAAAWGTPLGEAAGTLMENSLETLGLGSRRPTDLVYRLQGRIYMNITGLCPNACRFCIRDRADGIGGYRLAHGAEPDAGRLRRIVGLLEPGECDELVFCGYGEPTMRPELLRELASSSSARGFRVRLNTNGLCLERMSRERTLGMLAPFDSVSVSLNASGPEEYAEICRPGSPTAWENLLAFIRLARGVCSVRATAVRLPGLDMARVRALAGELGVGFMERA